jgi:hypothetical protein
MSAAVLGKLLAIIVTIGLGWVAGRLRWPTTAFRVRCAARSA